MLPVADQKKRGERCKLPENKQKQDVIGKNNPHHRALEQEQIGEKFAHIVVATEVMARISDDQKPNAQNEHGKEKAQAVEHQCKVQPQKRHPVDPRRHDLASEDSGKICKQADKSRERDRKCHAGNGRTARRIHQTGEQRPKKRQEDDEEKRHGNSC